MLTASALLSYLALRQFRSELEPELYKKGQILGDSVRRHLEGVLAYGLELDELRDLPEYLDSLVQNDTTILYIALTTPDGRLLQGSQGTPRSAAELTAVPHPHRHSLSINRDGQILARLHLVQDSRYADKRMQSIRLDILTVVAIGSLIAYELLLFWTATCFDSPIRCLQAMATAIRDGEYRYRLGSENKGPFRHLAEAIDQRLDRIAIGFAARVPEFQDAATGCRLAAQSLGPLSYHHPIAAIRWPFFMVIFSDALSVSFFPFYVDSLQAPALGISKEILISLPISLFMLVWALALPFAGAWSDRRGRKTAFLVGASITAVGLLATAAAETLLSLLLWRSLTAVGYAIVFITAQGYITDNTSQENRTRGMAGFVSAFFGGMLCGAAIGSILAERLGYRATFVISALLGFLAALFVLRFLERGRGGSLRRLRWADFRLLWGNTRFMAVALLAAIPSKIALTGFLYYAVLLHLKAIGTEQSDIGRAMVAYGAAIVLLAPLAAGLVDRARQRSGFVVLGGLLASLAMLLPYFDQSLLVAVLGIALLGIGHAVGVPAQLALATEVSRTEVERIGSGTVMGLFRLIERLGNVSGPLLAGTLMAGWGFQGAILGLSGINLLAVILLTLLLSLTASRARGGDPA